NALLLQSLPTNIPFWQVNARRRKDDTRVGTAARGIVERLSRLSRRLQSDGGSSGRVRHALSTGARDRGRPALHAPLPPGAPVACATQACRGHRGLGRCRATGSARLYWYRTMGPPAVDRGVGGSSGRAVGRTRWHHRLRSEQLPEARHAFGGGEAPVVWSPGQGRQLPGGCLYGICQIPPDLVVKFQAVDI